MKKTITLILFAMLFGSSIVFAQDLTFTLDGNVVEDNSTVYFSEWEDYLGEQTIKAKALIKNDTTNDIDITFSLTILEAKNVENVDICGITGCIPVFPGSPFSGTTTVEGNSSLNPDVYTSKVSDINDFLIKMEYKLEYQVGFNKETRIIYVVFSSDGASIDKIKDNPNTYVYKDAGDIMLNYDFQTDALRQLIIYNVIGRKVAEYKISNQYGEIQLPSNPKGIYVYSIIENNKVVKSGKYSTQ